MTRILLALALVFLPILAHGQTATWYLRWTQPNATPAQAQAYLWTVAVDGSTPVAFTPTCTTVNAETICSTPRPNPPETNPPATSHTYTLTVEDGFGSANASVTGNVPSAPTFITITINVQIP